MNFRKPKFWDDSRISFWVILLFPLSAVYSIIFEIRKFLSYLKTKKKFPIPVICVGNIYLGGTGKTPLVREIFKITKSLGKKPAFIKKKYSYLFDEIKMLRKVGETFTENNRQTSITLSAQKNYDIAILDDGFQDFTIKPDFSIVCFNSKQMIGNGFLIPSGPLREKLSGISRADCVIINGDKNEELENKIFKNINEKKLPIFYSKYKIKNIEKYKNKELIAFAGIGNPSNFFDLLRDSNLKLKKTYSFPDHYKYSNKDFENIKKDGSSTIITTEKDYQRLDDFQKQSCDFVEVDLEIEKKENLSEIIKSYI
tara:strand:+ start:56 stop:991 length:936 start_codon:yes stop_codon:yes gene_type:complete